MDTRYYRYIHKDVKVLDIPVYLLLFCVGLLILIMVASDTIILFFGSPDFPIIPILYGFIAVALLIGRFLDDRYFQLLSIQNMLLKSKRTKLIKTPVINVLKPCI